MKTSENKFVKHLLGLFGHCWRSGFRAKGTALMSYCPVSSARLTFCQPASVELCTLHTGGSSVLSRYVEVSCEISEPALTVLWAKVKVSTSQPCLPCRSPKNMNSLHRSVALTKTETHIPQTNLEVLSWLSIICFLFQNWRLGQKHPYYFYSHQ